MNEQDNSEVLDLYLMILEQAKQHDLNIQKAVEALGKEEALLQALMSNLRHATKKSIDKNVQDFLQAPKSDLEIQIMRVKEVTNELQQAKKDFDWRTNLWYFGGFAVLLACVIGFVVWFIPSLDEIRERKAQLSALTAQIEKNQKLARLQTANCGKDKQFCVKVINCNYGSNGNHYCVVDLKQLNK